MSGIAQLTGAPARDSGLGERPSLAGEDGFYEEAFARPGVPRQQYSELLEALRTSDLTGLYRAVAADLSARGVRFRSKHGTFAFRVDPVPRILTGTEWAGIEAGLEQRVRALNAFIADVYGDRAIVSEGVVPERVVVSADHYEPHMRGVPVPGGVYATVAGLDLVRGRDGEFQVLEDNLRTPSGLTYASAARAALDAHLPVNAPPDRRPLEDAFALLADALRGAALGGGGDPSIVLFSDGPRNSAWYEHKELARMLDLPIVTLSQLEHRQGKLHARIGQRPRPIDVLYRRTDEDRLTWHHGQPTVLGEALLEPCRQGRLACVNAFGSGVADDKLVHAYVEKMIRFYTGEEPILRSVPTYDLGDPGTLANVLSRIGELVIKPRTGHGGQGVVVCPHARPEDRDRVARLVRARPERFVAQETVPMSRHPTVCGGRLEPRHVDLRPFVITALRGPRAVPGGLTRVALDRNSLVVNSSQSGGGKDTWVLG